MSFFSSSCTAITALGFRQEVEQIKANVCYQRFFYFCQVFTFFNVFKIFSGTFLHLRTKPNWTEIKWNYVSVQFSSVTSLCMRLWTIINYWNTRTTNNLVLESGSSVPRSRSSDTDGRSSRAGGESGATAPRYTGDGEVSAGGQTAPTRSRATANGCGWWAEELGERTGLSWNDGKMLGWW